MSFTEYAKHGWKLCAITPGKKAPDYAKWNDPLKAADVTDAAEGLTGAGLLHALSGTCALDIDSLTAATAWLAQRGIDLQALLDAPNAVRIDSGRPGRAKLLYRLSRPLRTLKPTSSGLELRCATAAGLSMQDVLPPTIHPVTKEPYRWAYGDVVEGHWSKLPAIPAQLLALWREMAANDTAAAPVAPDTVEVNKLRELLAGKDPGADYDSWIKVGMALHHATSGAEEGLALWNEWSARAKDKYKGPDDLLVHWRSFSTTAGKRVVTARSLGVDDAAKAEEFPIEEVPVEGAPPEQPTTETLIEQQNEMQRKEAASWLEERLVFVRKAGTYFETMYARLIHTDRALEHEFTPYMPRSKNGRISPVKLLKESRTKRIVNSAGFKPGAGVVFKDEKGEDYANFYRDTRPQRIEPSLDDLERIEWLFNRIDDPVFRKWLRQFFAFAVQRPGIKVRSAPLIWSATEGNGKTTLLKVLPQKLVGAAYSCEVTSSLLNSDFNEYLLNAWHVNLAEFRADSKGERRAITAKLKSWIADPDISIHPKGLPAFTIPNYFFITATSNENDAASITTNDRRWAVHELRSARFTASEQKWIYEEFLNTDRAQGVLYDYFMTADIRDFNPNANAPETAAREDMITASLASDVEYLTRCFEERSGPLRPDVVRAADVVEAVRRATRANPSADRIGRLLSSPPINGIGRRGRVGKGTVRFVIIDNFERWSAASGAELLAESTQETIAM